MPVIVLYGEETFLLEQAVLGVRQATVNPAMASLCHKTYTKPSLASVLEAVGSVSLSLGGQTLIEICDFVWLGQAAKEPSTEAQLDELKVLLESLDPNKTVLFVSSKLDVRLKFPKWLTKHPGFQVQKFESFKFWEGDKVTQFLLHYAQQKGLQLQQEAASQLVSILGTDLRLLTTELEKLSLYAHQRTITKADVSQLSLHRDNLFQVVNRWILQENPSENFSELHDILLKRHPIEVFSVIQGYFNNIFRAVWLTQLGWSQDAIAQKTGQKPFTLKNNLRTFNRVSLPRWKTLKHQLVELEWQAKTGQLESRLALETLLAQ